MRKEAALPHGLPRQIATRPAGRTARVARTGIITAIIVLLLAGIASAQSPSGSILDRLQQLQARDRTAPGEAAVPPPSTPLETLVDPHTYRLFSGDQLHLGIWGEIPRTYVLPVGPEGDLVLPGQGPLRVAGLTLREAEESVIAALRPIYGQARVTLRLTQPARIRVMITGMVVKPGIYEVTGGDRLSSLLELAGGVRPGGSLRRIVVRPSDGQSTDANPREIDMLPWSLRGEIGANPFLQPGLRVEVPTQTASVRIRGPVFSRGALQAPTTAAGRIGDRPEEEPDLCLELREGDTVGVLLDQVGGLSDRATGRGILHRGDGPPRPLDLTSPDGRSVVLRPDDMLEVEYALRWIFVTGSVRSPGRFPYLPGLGARDYIYLAGGPTEIGRSSGWTIEAPGGKRKSVSHAGPVPPGSTLRVPERRSYWTTTWLSPLSTASALIISVVALTRR
jgi:protein involved in polysaccharide export with SLBB domain